MDVAAVHFNSMVIMLLSCVCNADALFGGIIFLRLIGPAALLFSFCLSILLCVLLCVFVVVVLVLYGHVHVFL